MTSKSSAVYGCIYLKDRYEKISKGTYTACIVSITAKSGLYKERKRCKIVKKGE